MSTQGLFSPFHMGPFLLSNRIVLPPMTRSRANNPGRVPNPIMATYYGQRANAGLLISEGSQVSPRGQGYAWTPGIYSADQVEGWKKITSAVKEKGGHFFLQLWHVGRVSHPDLLDGKTPLAPSAIAPKNVRVFTEKDTFKEVGVPQEMSLEDIQKTIEEFAQGAKNALLAGFDGVELHAANGYLINQFIDSNANTRTDAYGGSIENRLRFLSEVTSAVIKVVGRERVGVRLAPLTTHNGCEDATPEETYLEAVKLLNDLGVAYVHIAEADWDDAPLMPDAFKEGIRKSFKGALIYAGNYTKARAEEAVASGLSDLIGFGRLFVSNPDLVERLLHDYPLALHDRETLFGGGAKGLIDYPAYQG